MVTKRYSPFSLYLRDLASFTMGRYNPKDAEGFVNLFSLPVTLRPKSPKPKATISSWLFCLCLARRMELEGALPFSVFWDRVGNSSLNSFASGPLSACPEGRREAGAS